MEYPGLKQARAKIAQYPTDQGLQNLKHYLDLALAQEPPNRTYIDNVIGQINGYSYQITPIRVKELKITVPVWKEPCLHLSLLNSSFDSLNQTLLKSKMKEGKEELSDWTEPIQFIQTQPDRLFKPGADITKLIEILEDRKMNSTNTDARWKIIVLSKDRFPELFDSIVRIDKE